MRWGKEGGGIPLSVTYMAHTFLLHLAIDTVLHLFPAIQCLRCKCSLAPILPLSPCSQLSCSGHSDEGEYGEEKVKGGGGG